MRRGTEPRRVGVVAAAAAAAALIAAAQGAPSGLLDRAGASTTMTVSCTPSSAGANATCQGFQDFGQAAPSSATTHFPPGWQFAQSVGTSPLTPAPNNGDVVGSVDLYADVLLDGCGNPTHQTYPLTWTSPPDANSPEGTVAEVVGRATLLVTTTTTVHGYFVHSDGDSAQSSPHDDLVITYPVTFLCENEPVQSTWTIDGVVAGTSRVVERLPTTSGTYTVVDTWSDGGNGGHVDSATTTVT